MGHTPYGYKIENGRAVIVERQAEQIRELYEGYLSSLALMQAAKKAGLHLYHGSAKRMMQNAHYLGDAYYPAIIERGTFDKVEAELMKRAEKLGRIFEEKEQAAPESPIRFTIGTVKQKYDDPFKQAEYTYGQIESEVTEDGTEQSYSDSGKEASRHTGK